MVATMYLPAKCMADEALQLTYENCVTLAQKSLDAEAQALAKGEGLPITPMPHQYGIAPHAQNQKGYTLPDLLGGAEATAFKTALAESGAHIFLDPSAEGLAPQVELETRPRNAKEGAEKERVAEKPLEVQQRDFCQKHYGISF